MNHTLTYQLRVCRPDRERLQGGDEMMNFVVFIFCTIDKSTTLYKGKKQQRAHSLNNKIGDSISIMALKFIPIILLLMPNNLIRHREHAFVWA